MNCVLTNAQIDLIATDVSVIDYGTTSKKHGKDEFDDSPADTGSIKRANEDWVQRYGSGKNAGKGLSIGSIFGEGVKSDVGVKLE